MRRLKGARSRARQNVTQPDHGIRQTHAPGVAAPGQRIKVRGGPFSRRWAYFVAAIAGQASVDVILVPNE